MFILTKSNIQPFTSKWPLDTQPASTNKTSTFRPQGLCVCFVLFLQQTAVVSLNRINRLASSAETQRVSCEVRIACIFTTWKKKAVQVTKLPL
jgi:hypothetical protein